VTEHNEHDHKAAESPPGSASPAAAGSVFLRGNGRLLDWGSAVTAFIPFAALCAILGVLLWEAIPAIRYNGFGFLTGRVWDVGSSYGGVSRAGGVLHPLGAKYGALPIIAGTLETAGIALVVGLPVAVGAAILLVEKVPRQLASAGGLVLEVLAGVPSVVIGLWGLFTFGPWLAKEIYPALSHLGGPFAGSVGTGEGLLTAGLVLAAMIIPIIAATTRDLLRQVPTGTKEGAIALGMTDAEAFMTVQVRWVRAGIIGAAVLGLGRALGETIAVALITGSVLNFAANIFGTSGTIATTIVEQLDSALGDPTHLEVYSLAEAALVLFAITLLVNVAARVIVRRSAGGAALPVGAGF
jgi:phosphate transport system permease protein